MVFSWKVTFGFLLSQTRELNLTDNMKKSDEMKAKLDDLSTRVNVAREANNPKEARGLNEASTFGVATRLVAELVAGLLVGILVGWYLDQYFDTKPWLMIIMIMLGSAAGITNVMRAAKQLMPSEPRNEHDKK
jgi:ATP synthase protein I